MAAAPPPILTLALWLCGAALPAVRHCLRLPQSHGRSCWQPQGLRRDPGWADSTHTGAPWSWRAAAWFAAGLRRSGRWLNGHGHCQTPLECTPGQAVAGKLSLLSYGSTSTTSSSRVRHFKKMLSVLRRVLRSMSIIIWPCPSFSALLVCPAGLCNSHPASFWRAATNHPFGRATDCSFCEIACCAGAAASVKKQTFVSPEQQRLRDAEPMHCTCQLLIAEQSPPAHRCTSIYLPVMEHAFAAHLTAKLTHRRTALPTARHRLGTLQCTSLWACLLLHSKRSRRAGPRQMPQCRPRCALRRTLCLALLLGAAPQHRRP